jgi:hippurate hydrolase
MATEDFGHYSDGGAVPVVYWMLGVVSRRQLAAAPGRGPDEKLGAVPPNHSSRFAPDVRTALPTAVSALAVAALAHLGPPR